MTVATGKEAREPKIYILLAVGQTIGLISHTGIITKDTVYSVQTVDA